MSSSAEPGIDWVCPNCGAVLLSACYPGQVLDLLIRCYSCEGVSATEKRRAGQPLPGRHILVPPGQYFLSATVVANRPVLTIGTQASEGYARETASSAFGAREAASSDFGINQQDLNRLADDLTDLLGNKFEKLWLRDQRGLRSKSPPSRRHRQVELITYVRGAAAALQKLGTDGRTALDGNLLAEAILTRSLFQRWQNHPFYSGLVRDLADETSGQHAVMLLGVASYLVDAGNGVGIESGEGSTGRIADLYTVPVFLERLDIEVKTPFAFRGPLGSPMTYETAKRVVKTLVGKAASTRDGQLLNKSGILSIGAYHLQPGETDIIEKAAEAALVAQAEHKSHLAAVTVSVVSFQQEIVKRFSGEVVRRSFSPTLNTRVIRHPGYKGSLTINDTERAIGSG